MAVRERSGVAVGAAPRRVEKNAVAKSKGLSALAIMATESAPGMEAVKPRDAEFPDDADVFLGYVFKFGVAKKMKNSTGLFSDRMKVFPRQTNERKNYG